MSAVTVARAITVVIADDQPLMRAALRTILEADGVEVLGEAGDGDTAIGLVARLQPAVVLMDVRMPGRDGLSATAAVRAQHPAVAVLVLTTFDDDETLFGALRAGAQGFLLKNAGPEALQQAVRSVVDGDAVLDPAVTARVMRKFVGDTAAMPTAEHSDIARLTEREKDVLWLLGTGLTNAEIAQALAIGEATAKSHVSNVILKLGVRDRVQAVIKAFEAGFARQPRHVQRHAPGSRLAAGESAATD